MNRKVIFLLGAAVICWALLPSVFANQFDSENRRVKRLIKGHKVDHQLYNFVASLNDDYNKQCQIKPFIPGFNLAPFCAGVVLDQWSILTSATCVHNRLPESFVVRLGGITLNQMEKCHEVDKIEILNGFNVRTPTNGFNLAMLKLKKPVQFSKSVKSIDLPVPVYSMYYSCKLLGWGKSKHENYYSHTLHYQDVNVSIKVVANTTDQPYLIKVREESACTIDSGGPLICRITGFADYYLVGVGANYHTIFSNQCEPTPIYTNAHLKKLWISTTRAMFWKSEENKTTTGPTTNTSATTNNTSNKSRKNL